MNDDDDDYVDGDDDDNDEDNDEDDEPIACFSHLLDLALHMQHPSTERYTWFMTMMKKQILKCICKPRG